MKHEVATDFDKLPINNGPQNLLQNYQNALQVVDDVVTKNYVTTLEDLEVVPLDKWNLRDNLDQNVRLFKVTEMVYEKEEFATYKFTSVFNTLAATNSSVFVILDSNGVKTDFYMGIRCDDPERTASSVRETLMNSLAGQFPGAKTKYYDNQQTIDLLNGFSADSIATVSCVADNREDSLNENATFVQGLEKLVLSMSGQKYTGVIIASSATADQIKATRAEYENLYSQLSPMASIQLNYGKSINVGVTESFSDSESKSYTEGTSSTKTNSESFSNGSSDSYSVSKENTTAKVLKGLGVAAGAIGAVLAPATGGISAAVGMPLQLAAMAATKVETETHGSSHSHTKGTSESFGENHSTTSGQSKTVTHGNNSSEGNSNALTLVAHDKRIENILARIDRQLERIDEFESLGMYECAAYFMSDDQVTSEIAASTYKAIVGGRDSGVESSAVNVWGNQTPSKTKMIGQYVRNFMHPVFKYQRNEAIEVTPCVMVSGEELAIHMGLPRKSVAGFPVIEHADFAKEVVNYDGVATRKDINLGKIFNMGKTYDNPVWLDSESLAMHTFITGSTGSGKSNTTYELVRQAHSRNLKFLIIEPAKGEYKNVFGNWKDVNVYGSNSAYAKPLRINPFRFPKDIHVLEHIDRLVEIFNVCWPMYAAMPAVLKDAILRAYESCGWDLATSKNRYGSQYFPDFTDLLRELERVIETSAYSEEVKSNYKGSLLTRVKSLTNGLNETLFSADEISEQKLFDENTIIDLSRIGSSETKSLIMGVLVMRLSEYRMSTTSEMNSHLKHITVLEEAHNILKRTSTEQNPENPNLGGKSVEMIANAIAEMRTYGEGFVIVDQSPSAVDISAIRNTNTKIVLRLPDSIDRESVGKSAGLKDEQIDEIARLPKGVAVVYQNDWVEPVLCKINKFNGKESRYNYTAVRHIDTKATQLNEYLLKMLLKDRVNEAEKIELARIEELLSSAKLPARRKIVVKELLKNYRNDGSEKKEFSIATRADKVWELLELSQRVERLARVRSVADLDSEIVNIIREQAPSLDAKYILAATQLIVRKSSSDVFEESDIYNAWVTELKKKGNVTYG
ncbi:MAG: DUF87 domain-containing protein [Ligilactobacillus animalis]|uniref:ATP-binding protein n=1 Tax=Ligilactobacillus animalis TaxID=1605 RepID=UPI00242D4BE6|nr:DUF87 domain-containing protein [Ligilactobacillus animalis]MCI5941520.1 DUF87 domain-containing protein [Ligilactobacillus animalis]MDY2994119.1 DUF87 domain-containing protein [Ligilactobacillus animalis]